MKKLFLILCALVLCSSSYAGNIKDIKKVIARKNACDTAIYTFNTGKDSNFTCSYDSASSTWTGTTYTPPADQHVCKVDIYIGQKDGSWSEVEDDVYLSIYSLQGTNDLDAELGRSASVDGKNFVSNTWTSANAGEFVFSSSVALTGSTKYAFATWRDADADPEDEPEINTTHFWRLGYDNGNDNSDAQNGILGWRGSDGTDQVGSPTSDILIIIYGWND